MIRFLYSDSFKRCTYFQGWYWPVHKNLQSCFWSL